MPIDKLFKYNPQQGKKDFCIKHQQEENTWEHTGGDGVEYETWYCRQCDLDWETPMEISRFWNKSKQLS